MPTKQRKPKPIGAAFIRTALESDTGTRHKYSQSVISDPRNHVGTDVIRDLAEHLANRGIRL